MSSEEVGSKTTPTVSDFSDIGKSMARYLFEISVLSTTGDDRIATGDLQDRLEVTPASVTEMISKLDERGFVEYEKYQGVTLTDQGELIAQQVAWRFCVVSSFFDSELDTTLDDQTAFEMGFMLPKEGILRLREIVNGPCLDLCPESEPDSQPCIA